MISGRNTVDHMGANTVTIARYFPNTISTSETGELIITGQFILSVFCKDFIDKTDTEINNMKITPMK